MRHISKKFKIAIFILRDFQRRIWGKRGFKLVFVSLLDFLGWRFVAVNEFRSVARTCLKFIATNLQPRKWGLVTFLFFMTCVAAASSSEPEAKKGDGSAQELSLKQDRKELDELRKDVPDEVKRENDDLAFILKLFDDKKRKPAKIRNEFNKSFNRLRKKQQKEFKKERSAFTKNEKSIRDKYISDAKKKRTEFMASGANSDSKKQFFVDERAERKAFFSDQKEKRNEFEADHKAKRKETDDFMKDRRKDFDDRYKQFVKDQKDLEKMEKDLKKQRNQNSVAPPDSEISQKNQKYLDDFKKIPKRGGSQLAPPEEK